jgi:hypothetical protein
MEQMVQCRNYSLILEILLMMPHLLCPEILLSTALVSKECYSLTCRAWTLLQYNEGSKFQGNFNEITMSRSEAKKKYKLCDDDLNNMFLSSKQIVRSFFKSDVLALALIKHKGPAGLKAICHKKMSAAKTKRIAAVCNLFGTADLTVLGVRHEVEQFLSNGKGGVRKLKESSIRRENLCCALREHGLVIRADSRLCAQYIESGVPELSNVVLKERDEVKRHEKYMEKLNTRRKNISTRRENLCCALREHGLVIRADSRLCDQYIESGVPELCNVVLMMRQMNFFYNKTRYPNMLHGSISNYKGEIREYGWVSSEEFGELIRDHIQKVQYSIKQKALSELPSNVVPDYMMPILK